MNKTQAGMHVVCSFYKPKGNLKMRPEHQGCHPIPRYVGLLLLSACLEPSTRYWGHLFFSKSGGQDRRWNLPVGWIVKQRHFPGKRLGVKLMGWPYDHCHW